MRRPGSAAVPVHRRIVDQAEADARGAGPGPCAGSAQQSPSRVHRLSVPASWPPTPRRSSANSMMRTERPLPPMHKQVRKFLCFNRHRLVQNWIAHAVINCVSQQLVNLSKQRRRQYRTKRKGTDERPNNEHPCRPAWRRVDTDFAGLQAQQFSLLVLRIFGRGVGAQAPVVVRGRAHSGAAYEWLT